jgi:hypothetical protein
MPQADNVAANWAGCLKTAMITRRNLLATAGVLFVMNAPRRRTTARAQPASTKVDLLSAPLELSGEWDGSPQRAAAVVIGRMREVCLASVRLVSDQQPERVRVDDHSSGNPAIWLHDEPAKTAWIIVDIGTRAWCQLAYQFGHELGHVLCNSWQRDAKPHPPSRWLEEALVEAFSIRGLALLADSWERDPPLPGDASYSKAIRDYRANLIEKYRTVSWQEESGDIASGFRRDRTALEHSDWGSAVLTMLAEEERNGASLEDLGALNRWPARTGVPVEEYLSLWQTSCAELGAAGHFPARLRELLRLG